MLLINQYDDIFVRNLNIREFSTEKRDKCYKLAEKSNISVESFDDLINLENNAAEQGHNVRDLGIAQTLSLKSIIQNSKDISLLNKKRDNPINVMREKSPLPRNSSPLNYLDFNPSPFKKDFVFSNWPANSCRSNQSNNDNLAFNFDFMGRMSPVQEVFSSSEKDLMKEKEQKKE